MKKIIAIIFILYTAFSLSGCAQSTGQIVDSESESQVQVRSYQTREYDVDSKLAIRSVISVLQDLGFVIDRADTLTGTISATKLDGYKIEMTVSLRQKGDTRTSVRANAQYGVKAITEPEIYQDFFTSLDKSIFLEKNL
jgi:hypothetical protein